MRLYSIILFVVTLLIHGQVFGVTKKEFDNQKLKFVEPAQLAKQSAEVQKRYFEAVDAFMEKFLDFKTKRLRGEYFIPKKSASIQDFYEWLIDKAHAYGGTYNPTPGEKCGIAGFRSKWSHRLSCLTAEKTKGGSYACMTQDRSGKMVRGHYCNPRFFLYAHTDGKGGLHCVPLTSQLSSIQGDPLYRSCKEARDKMIARHEKADGTNPYIEKSLELVATSEGKAGQSNDVTYQDIETEYIDDYVPYCRSVKAYINNKSDEKLATYWGCKKTSGGALHLAHTQRCSCFDLFKRGTVIAKTTECIKNPRLPKCKKGGSPSAPGDVPGFLDPIKCITDTIPEISPKYLAMLGIANQKMNKILDDTSGRNNIAQSARGDGAYNLTLNQVKTYESVWCKSEYPNSEPRYVNQSLTPRDMFLVRMIEHIEAKGYCSAKDYKFTDSELTGANYNFLRDSFNGHMIVTDGSWGNGATSIPAKNYEGIFGVRLGDSDFEEAIRGENFGKAYSWSIYGVKDRREYWQDMAAKSMWGGYVTKMSPSLRKCVDSTKKSEYGEKLCIRLAESCGLTSNFCGRVTKRSFKCKKPAAIRRISGARGLSDGEGAAR